MKAQLTDTSTVEGCLSLTDCFVVDVETDDRCVAGVGIPTLSENSQNYQKAFEPTHEIMTLIALR